MPFILSGYLLEPPRVGQSNSPFTSTPNNFVSDLTTYNMDYPSSEANPRDDYLVLVTSEVAPVISSSTGTVASFTLTDLSENFITSGVTTSDILYVPSGPNSGTYTITSISSATQLTTTPVFPYAGSIAFYKIVGSGLGGPPIAGPAGLLVNAGFGWTKNEVVQRFDYDTRGGRFRTLPGGPLQVVGVLSLTSNTQRLMVQAPIELLAAAPYRLSIGTVGSGITQIVSLVLTDADFTGPALGMTELSLATGNLNWNAGDLTTYEGQTVQWQQQQYFPLGKSTGNIGTLTTGASAPATLLNPIPGAGQYPLLRFGYLLWLTTVEVPDEAHFTPFPGPASGTVEWALTTGRLNFNSADVTNNAGTGVYYDGVLFARDLTLPRTSGGTVGSPTAITLPNPATGDIIFALEAASPYYQFPSYELVTSFSSGTAGTVQIKTSGAVQFSVTDQGKYGSQAVTVISGDLPIDHGISIRFFRSPVDLDAQTEGVKDVTAIYSVTNAVWASPIMGSPQVFLPSTPIDDDTLKVTVNQDEGTFTGSLNRVDTPSPTAGLGYYINFDTNTFTFAQRKNDVLIPLLQPQGFVQLPDLLVLTSNMALSLETGTGTNVFTALTPGINCVVDATAGLVYFTITSGIEIASGSVGTFSGISGTTFSDSTANFTASGVLARQFLVVESGYAEGVYTIVSVTSSTSLTVDVAPPSGSGELAYEIFGGQEILADRFFEPVELIDPTTTVERINALGMASNNPRLSIPLSDIGVTRIRLGPAGSNFSTAVNPVLNDASFTSPGSLPEGIVEVSQVTGNLNFSSADLTQPVTFYSSVAQRLNVDYQVQPALGLIQFTTRLLTNEEVLLTYVQAPPITSPPTPPSPPFVGEQGTFLVPKELTQPHPTPTSTLSFNPTGKTVASNPQPAVFRGGRPQVVGTQCTVNTTNSTITFLPDDILTDALPHGSIVAPTENVYIDYYIDQAMGGERTVTVLNPPMLVAQVVITEATNSFVIAGSFLADFPVGFLMLVAGTEIYSIGSTTYDSVLNQTTVTLSGTQTFQSDQTNPALAVTSGPTPITSLSFNPAYFVPELQAYDPVARGSTSMTVVGNRTTVYQQNTIVYFTDSVSSFTDFLIVVGSQYNATTGETTVTFTTSTLRQYVSGTQILSYSVRPIFNEAPTIVHTSRVPVANQPVTVFRRIAGDVGVLLTSPTGYTIDSTGTVTFATALEPGEAFSIFYTGHNIIAAGPRVKASYTSSIVPTQANGLLGQTLNANYTLFSPDNFYYRVETMTNFKGEVLEAIEQAAMSGSPSSGPMTSNASSPELYDQGRPSLWFPEGDYANQDIIARVCLVFFNAAINSLEDVLHAIDGRVVGDADGRFMFDGVIGRTIHGFPPTGVLNQIDDLVQVSPFPLPNGTYKQIYLAGPYSRFFKTRRNIFTTSPALGGQKDRDPIAQYTFQNLSSLPDFTFKRWPRAQIQYNYDPGTQTFAVDNANGTSDLLQRPSFVDSMLVVIEDASSNVYLSNVSVTSFTEKTITLSAAVGVAVPAGATIYVSPSDANSAMSSGDYPPGPGSNGAYNMNYQFGKDVNATLSTGELDYITRKFPFNGVIPLIPFSFNIFPVQPGDILQANGAGVNVTYTAPYEFPALTGGTTDDDGDQAVPIVGPTFDGELTPAGGGPLNIEASYEQEGGFFRTSTTTPPFVGTGTLTTTTTITLSSGDFPSPVPQVWDLVRIVTTGTNGYWRRITAATLNSVTVGASDAFSAIVGSFLFAVAVSSSTVGGTCTLSGTTLTDTSQIFSPVITPVAPIGVSMSGEAFISATAGVAQPDITIYRLSANTTVGGISSLIASASILTPMPLAGVGLGWTIVMTGGPNAGLRRQVTAILDDHDLSFDHAFPNPTSGGTYRIDNPLNTYNGPVLTDLQDAVSDELETILTNASSEQNALLAFFSTIFTPAPVTLSGTFSVTSTSPSVSTTTSQIGVVSEGTIITFGSQLGTNYTVLSVMLSTITLTSNYTGTSNPSTTGIAIVGSSNGDVSGSPGHITAFSDSTVDFIASEVTTSDLVYIQSGSGMGVYQIQTITDAHDLVLSQSVPTALTGVTYEIVSYFGTTFSTLQSLFTILTTNAIFVPSTTAFQTLLNSSVPVLLNGAIDPDEYANGIEDSGDDLGNRYTVVSNRQAYLSPTNATGPISIIEESLNSSDQLYAKRYTWIDARINQQTGYLVLEQQAAATRLQTQENVYKQLIKLLTIEGS